MTTQRRRINARQSKDARAILKWSVIDVSSHTSHLTPNDMKEFESGLLQLQQGPMDELVRAYEQEGIEFLDSGKVMLKKPETLYQSVSEDRHTPGRRGQAPEEIEVAAVDDRNMNHEQSLLHFLRMRSSISRRCPFTIF